MEKSLSITRPVSVFSRIQDYGQLTKVKLSLLVVFSAALAFIMGSQGDVNWGKLVMLVIGGYLVTGAANAFNQVIEREHDQKMDRTALRPLPDNRLSVQEALIVASVFAVCGLLILTLMMNVASGVLGLIAIISYTLLYTPLKRITPFAVFVGAFPGAIPPLLGWVAASNSFTTEGWVWFCIQFIWQFPHFWAIAWVLDDDYRKAGFELLPSRGGRDKSSAFQTFIYTFSLIPMGFIPWFFQFNGVASMIIVTLAGVIFTFQAWTLYRECSMKAARKLMFGSFIYLPLVQLALVLDAI